MSKSKQFWALFKFQSMVNPFIWIICVALASPLFISGVVSNSSHSYQSNLSSLLPVQNIFFIGFLGMMVIAPEAARSLSTNNASISGTEFLLTRAVDRAVLYRAKAAFLYLLVLVMPLMSLCYSLKDPDLQVTEYSGIAQQECLSHVPGSFLAPNPSGSLSPLISIPRGKPLIEEWHIWMFLDYVLGVQALILLLYPFKYRSILFYALFIVLIFLPLFSVFRHVGEKTPSKMESLFFSFAAHQPLFWIVTALVLILGQVWCERRFAQLEQ